MHAETSTSNEPIPLPEEIRQFLERFGKGTRRIHLTVDSFVLLGALFTLLGALFLGDYLFTPGPEVRSTLLGMACIILLGLVFRVLLHVLSRTGLDQLALTIERRADVAFHNTLITSVELAGGRDAERFGYSPHLIEACSLDAAARLKGVQVEELLDRTPLVRARRFATGAFLCSAALLLWGHDAIGTIARRYAGLHHDEIARSSPVRFFVEPGDVVLAAGSPLTVSVRLEGSERFPSLDIDGPAGSPSPPPLKHQDGWYRARFSSVRTSFTYRFATGPFQSRTHQVRVVEPPEIASLALRYVYPAYTGIEPLSQTRGPYDIVAPVGTTVHIAGRATRPVTSAHLLVGDSPPAALAVSEQGMAFQGKLTVEENSTFGLLLHGSEGFPSPSTRHRITATPDRPPQVFLVEPGRDLSLAQDEISTLPLSIFVTDDYGVASARLVYSLRQHYEYTFLTSDFEVPLEIPSGETYRFSLKHVWDLRERFFQPGDLLTYHVEATDARPVEPRQVGRSRTFAIRVPYRTDLLEEALAEEEEQIESIEDLSRRQKDIDAVLERTISELEKSGEMDWRKRNQLGQLAEKQEELKRKAARISREMEQTVHKLTRNELLDEATLTKLAQIQELFQEVASERMKNLMQRMQDLMSQSQVDPKKMSAMKNRIDKEKYTRELDRVLANLKKVKAQQELTRALETARELAREQDDLRQETGRRMAEEETTKEEASYEDLAPRQKKAAQKARDLSQKLSELAGELSEIHPETSERLQDLAARAEQREMVRNMERANMSLQTNEGRQAYQEESNALNAMQQMLDDLIQAESSMQQQQVELSLERMMKLIRYGLDISKTQEALLASSVAGQLVDVRKNARILAARQDRVFRGMKTFERDFGEIVSDEASFKTPFVLAVSELVDQTREAVSAFEAIRIHTGRQLAKEALGGINEIVARLIEIAQQLMDRSSSSSMQGFFDQLEQLIQRQERLNEMTQRLQPQQGMSRALEQMMQQMAAEQQLIRESLEELTRRYEKSNRVLGDLEGLGREMKEVEEALRKLDVGADTQRRQERVLTRMLEAEKSAHQQGRSKKRVARLAKPYETTSPQPLEDQLTEVRKRLFENVSRQAVPVQYREVVEAYMKALVEAVP